MITITIEHDKITIDGHANYAPIGQDIVCSGVSTLIQTLIESIRNLTTDSLEGELLPGNAMLHTKHLSDSKSKLLIEAFFIGINGIAESYPDYVHIIREDGSRQG